MRQRPSGTLEEPVTLVLESDTNVLPSTQGPPSPLPGDSPHSAPRVAQLALTEYQCELASSVTSHMTSDFDRIYLLPLRGKFIPKLRELIDNINTVLSSISTSSLVELCSLCYCDAKVVTVLIKLSLRSVE